MRESAVIWVCVCVCVYEKSEAKLFAWLNIVQQKQTKQAHKMLTKQNEMIVCDSLFTFMNGEI